MNTPASEITLFNYDDKNKQTLYEWCKNESEDFISKHDFEYQQQLIAAATNLPENGYADRALLGIYCKWFFEEYILTQQTADKKNKFN